MGILIFKKIVLMLKQVLGYDLPRASCMVSPLIFPGSIHLESCVWRVLSACGLCFRFGYNCGTPPGKNDSEVSFPVIYATPQ